MNVNNKKMYIGGYVTQKEAAVAYDFYWIGLRGTSAKTNFNYEREVVIDMIRSYFDNNKVFVSSDFAHLI